VFQNLSPLWSERFLKIFPPLWGEIFRTFPTCGVVAQEFMLAAVLLACSGRSDRNAGQRLSHGADASAQQPQERSPHSWIAFRIRALRTSGAARHGDGSGNLPSASGRTVRC